MTSFALRQPWISDPAQQANNEDLLTGLNFVAQFVSAGEGAPSHTPDGPQIYFRYDGGAGTTLYVYEPGPAAWNALA
jgi:hypothetical protein